jgi:hypothetical protein
MAVADLWTFKNLFLVILAFISYKALAQIIYYRFFHPLRKFPGPFLASITRLWIGWHCWRQTELQTIYKLHEKYGQSTQEPSEILVADHDDGPCTTHHAIATPRQ